MRIEIVKTETLGVIKYDVVKIEPLSPRDAALKNAYSSQRVITTSHVLATKNTQEEAEAWAEDFIKSLPKITVVKKYDLV